MSHLALSFLGSPQIELDHSPHELKLRKAIALLAVLATSGQDLMRDTLASFLWPETDAGRNHLRYALWTIRNELGPHWLQADREFVALNPKSDFMVDVKQFQTLLAQANLPKRPADQVDARFLPSLEQAVDLYRDDFLSGFTLRGCPEFDEWQTLHTEGYRHDLALALESLVAGFTRSTDYPRAISYAGRWVALDPLHEPAQRSLMWLYAQTGHRAEALRQYRACTHLLQEELGVSPGQRTTDLYQDILARRFPVAERLDVTIHEELRPVTVLCVGLVDPTTNEAGKAQSVAAEIVQLWAALSDCLAPYGAHIHQMLAHSMLAVLGAEQMHEDDAERALLAAMAIREEAKRRHLAVSLGLGSGLAFVARSPDQAHTTLAMGSAVNLAARLQAHAQAGEILVGPVIYRRLHSTFRFAPVRIDGSGPSSPQDAYRLRQAYHGSQRARWRTGAVLPMLGRDQELNELIGLAESVQIGQGRLALIAGEAGIGKSRLVEELHRHVERHLPGAQWLEGRCQELGMSTHFWPVREMIRSLVDTVPDAGPADRILAFSQQLVDGHILTLAERAKVLPVMAWLGGVKLGEPWDKQLDGEEPDGTRNWVLKGVRELILALVRQGPTVIVFEDLHWADQFSLDLFIQLMDNLADLPLLLIGVYRTQRDHRVWQLPVAAANHCPGRFEELALHRLTLKQIRQLLHSLLATDRLPEELEEVVLAQAQGNPFYLEEVIRNLKEGGALKQEGGIWRMTPCATEPEISQSVHSIILARSDRLDEGHRAVLQRAAVLGPHFPFSLLAALCAGEPLQESTVQPLIEQAFLYQEESYPEPVYAFAHILIRQALYTSLVEKDRRRLHGLAAQTLQAKDRSSTAEDLAAIAYHWEQSDHPGRAIPYLLEAGERARLAFATQEAEAYYRRAIAVQREMGDEMGAARTWMALGLTYLNAHEYTQSQAAYNAGYDLWTVVGRRVPAVIHPARRPLRELCGFRNASLDPARQDSPVLGSALYSGLFEETPDLLAAPDLARQWSVSADGCTYTFRLHDDRRWSDGAPVTAQDLFFAWRRLLDPQAGFSTASLLYDVAGAEAYHHAQLADPEQLGLAALDDLTLSVTLREPTSYFLQILTHPATYPVPRHLLLSNPENAWDPANIVTNGALRVVSWKKMAHLWGRDQYGLVAERNPAYPGRFPGNLRRIESGPTDWSVAAHLHDDGELDVLALMLMPDDDSRRLLRTQGWQFLPNRHWDVVYLGFDTTQPPFDDVRVRQAIAMSIDRPQMARLFVPGSPPTTGGFVPRGMGGHSPDIGLPFDPQSARRLLAQAGYPGGKGFPEIEYVTPPQAGGLKDTVMEFVQSNLGIHLAWQPIGAQGVPSPRRLFMWTCSAPYADPSCYLRLGFPWRDTGWRDPVYDRLLDEARRTLDLPHRLDLYRAADRILMEQAVIVPLYMGTSPVLVKPWVTHYPISGIRWAYYKDVVLAAEK